MDRLRPGQSGLRITRSTPTNWQSRRSRPITDGLSDAVEPVFDAGGKYLYFFASTDAGPVNQWFSQRPRTCAMRRSIYLVVLPQGRALAAGPRERRGKAGRQDRPTKPNGETAKDDKAKDAKAGQRPSRAGGDRLRAASSSGSWPCPSRPANYSNLQAGQAGQIFYLDWTSSPHEATPEVPAARP